MKKARCIGTMGGEKDMVVGEAFTFVDLLFRNGRFPSRIVQLGGECVWACDIDPDSKTGPGRFVTSVASGKFFTNIRLG